MVNNNFISHVGMKWGGARILIDLPYKNAINHFQAAFHKPADASVSPTLTNRVKNFALGVLLLIPVINIIVEIAIRAICKNQPATPPISIDEDDSDIEDPSEEDSLEDVQEINHEFSKLSNGDVPKDVIVKIMSLCSVKDQIAFSSACRRFRSIYQSSSRLQKLCKIARCFANAQQFQVKVPHARFINFDPIRKEYLVGQHTNYDDYGQNFALIFDENLDCIDDISRIFTFDKSVESIIPTKGGNAIVSSKYNENKIAYWNRTMNRVTMQKKFGIIDEQVADTKIAYSAKQERFYIGNIGSLEIYDESNGVPQLIETISLPIERDLIQMILDEDNNCLWLLTGEPDPEFDHLEQYLLKYDLLTKTIQKQINPFCGRFNVSFDKNKNWLIGISKNNELILWDTRTNSLLLNREIPRSGFAYSDAVHYNPDKKLFFFFLEPRDEEDRYCKGISGKLMIWDIENDTLKSPDLNLEMFSNGLRYDTYSAEHIHYRSDINVVFMITNASIIACDLESGCLIPDNSLQPYLIPNLLIDNLIINDASDEIIAITKSTGQLTVLRYA